MAETSRNNMPQHWMDRDEERVPDGLTLGGYDACSRRYSYFDQEGTVWLSEPGRRFSTLTPGMLAVNSSLTPPYLISC